MDNIHLFMIGMFSGGIVYTTLLGLQYPRLTNFSMGLFEGFIIVRIIRYIIS